MNPTTINPTTDLAWVLELGLPEKVMAHQEALGGARATARARATTALLEVLDLAPVWALAARALTVDQGVQSGRESVKLKREKLVALE